MTGWHGKSNKLGKDPLTLILGKTNVGIESERAVLHCSLQLQSCVI